MSGTADAAVSDQAARIFPAEPTVDELIDFTPDLRAKAVQMSSKFALAKLFDPLVLSKPEGPYKSPTFATALAERTGLVALTIPRRTRCLRPRISRSLVLACCRSATKRFSEASNVCRRRCARRPA